MTWLNGDPDQTKVAVECTIWDDIGYTRSKELINASRYFCNPYYSAIVTYTLPILSIYFQAARQLLLTLFNENCL